MPDQIVTIVELLSRTDYWIGVGGGVVALAAFWLARDKTPTPGWGVSIALITTIGIQFVVGQHLGILAGVALMGIGGFLLDRSYRNREESKDSNPQAGWLLIVVGAITIGARTVTDVPWLSVALPVVAIGIGYALTFWINSPKRGSVGMLFLITAAGMWVTIPETDAARLLLGVASPLAIATTSVINARLSLTGAFALAGTVTWVTATGGVDRPSSIIAGWAAFGLLALVPILTPALGRLSTLRMILVHFGWVALVTRVFGLWDSLGAALIGVVLAVIAVVAIDRALPSRAKATSGY